MANLGTGTWRPPEYFAHVDPNAKRDPEPFPGWRFGPNGQSGLFQSDDEVPEGWSDDQNFHKEEVVTARIDTQIAEEGAPARALELPPEGDLDRDAVIEALTEAKVDFNPKWTTSRLNKVLRNSKGT